jgi:3-oxoacyl-[acyl-carrier-protein] synthase-3
LAAEAARIQTNDRVALLGIGSGINCQMLAVEWQQSLIRGRTEAAITEACE